jgi:hypothetical protein
MYASDSALSSANYDFRRDFGAIAKPGVTRCIEAQGFDPHQPYDDEYGLERWRVGQVYARELFGGLRHCQKIFERGETPVEFEIYGLKDWTRDGVESYVGQRLEGIIDSCKRGAE